MKLNSMECWICLNLKLSNEKELLKLVALFHLSLLHFFRIRLFLLAIPQFFLPLGSAVFALQFAADFLRCLGHFAGAGDDEDGEEPASLGH